MQYTKTRSLPRTINYPSTSFSSTSDLVSRMSDQTCHSRKNKRHNLLDRHIASKAKPNPPQRTYANRLVPRRRTVVSLQILTDVTQIQCDSMRDHQHAFVPPHMAWVLPRDTPSSLWHKSMLGEQTQFCVQCPVPLPHMLSTENSLELDKSVLFRFLLRTRLETAVRHTLQVCSGNQRLRPMAGICPAVCFIDPWAYFACHNGTWQGL